MARILLSLFAAILSLIISSTHAQQSVDFETRAPKAWATVPEVLKPWVQWAMANEILQDCPVRQHAGFSMDTCVWPSELTLDILPKGGNFRQTVMVFADNWVELPGGKGQWPLDVKIDGAEDFAVITRNDRPAVYLKAGRYTIDGTFRWDAMPEMLTLPENAGLVHLTIDGDKRPFFNVDNAQRLWIRNAEDATERVAKGETDSLRIQVFRLVEDNVPLTVETAVTLQVSGKTREEQLRGVVPDGFLPMRVTGNLPSRLEADGTLRVQVRAGTWQVKVRSYAASPLMKLQIPEKGEKQEIWSFADNSALRVVQVSGVPSIDPGQTEMPGEWRGYPAYVMNAGSTMELEVKRRGMETPDPDRLTLSRMWRLNGSGDGYTVQDNLSGTLSRSWRLDAALGTELGRVAIQGQDQFITALGNDKNAPHGVEVRPGMLNLNADSRYAGTWTFPAKLPAVGWQHDVDSLRATLSLPAGWSLLAAQGVDGVSSSWVKSWSLLDIFLVLVSIVAAFRLMGIAPAAVMGLALVLLHPENAFFTSAALTVLLAMGLLKVLPQGRFRTGVQMLRRLMLLSFVLAALPFMVTHIRNAIYPQLAVGWMSYPAATVQYGAAGIAADGGMVQERARPESRALASAPDMENVLSPLKKSSDEIREEAQQMTQQLYQYDANNRVQTGFGVPEAMGRSIQLTWNGPVEKDDTFRLWLLSPCANLVLAVLRLLLTGALLVLLLGITPWRIGRDTPKQIREALAVLMLVGVALTMMKPGAAVAEEQEVYPPAQMLDELRTRIAREINHVPECSPNCVSIARAKVFVAANELTIRMEAHAATNNLMVALPGGVANWRPTAVTLDGKPALNLRRESEGYLFASLNAGVHELVMTGPLPAMRDGVSLRFPLLPHYLEAAAVGWEVQGVRANGESDGNLQLVRLKDHAAVQQDADNETLESRPLPDFFSVERTLDLGLSWQVHTVVSRLTPAEGATSIAVPLLEGESLISDGIEVKDGKALLHFAAGEQAKRLQSRLAPRDQIHLRAADAVRWVESWRLNASNVWHVGFGGIPRVQDESTAMPQWRPWPGEEVKIAVTRPQGVEGPTLTIDRSDMDIRAGEKKSKTDLTLTLRSSQGGQHVLKLPEGAELQKLWVDGRDTTIQQKDGQVIFPVRRGAQQAKLEWLQDNPMGLRFKLPVVDVGAPTVNSHTQLELPHDRWVLMTYGPQMGPAVLLWGWVPVLLLIAVGLARVGAAPLRAHHWFLLLLGLTQTSLTVMVVVAGWFLAMEWRSRQAPEAATKTDRALWFNFKQVTLGGWTLLSLLLLFYGIQHGLLGSPDMRVAGQGSSSHVLRWYQDITDSTLPQPGVISAPLWLYRTLMLFWALWLAFSLVKWLKWGWQCFSHGGYWQSVPHKRVISQKENKASE